MSEKGGAAAAVAAITAKAKLAGRAYLLLWMFGSLPAAWGGRGPLWKVVGRGPGFYAGRSLYAAAGATGNLKNAPNYRPRRKYRRLFPRLCATVLVVSRSSDLGRRAADA